MGIDHRSSKRIHGGTEEDGANYAGHNTSWPEAQHLDPAAYKSDRHHRCYCEFKPSMGRTSRQTARQQVDHQSSRLVTTRIDKTTRETKREIERQPCSPFGTRMAKIGPRQVSVETAQRGFLLSQSQERT